MPLTFNGTSPIEIKYNGTDLTRLKYGNKYVWSKPYDLVSWIWASDGGTLVVTRQSSPYCGAATGEVTPANNVIYYGDYLKIEIIPDIGKQLTSFRINNTKYTSSPKYVTVTGYVSISDLVVATAPSQWYTIYTGKSSAVNYTTSSKTVVFSPTITIPYNTTKIRITGYYYSQSSTSVSFTDLIISGLSASSFKTYSFTSYVRLAAKNGANLQSTLQGKSFVAPASIYITKLEAYV